MSEAETIQVIDNIPPIPGYFKVNLKIEKDYSAGLTIDGSHIFWSQGPGEPFEIECWVKLKEYDELIARNKALVAGLTLMATGKDLAACSKCGWFGELDDLPVKAGYESDDESWWCPKCDLFCSVECGEVSPVELAEHMLEAK